MVLVLLLAVTTAFGLGRLSVISPASSNAVQSAGVTLLSESPHHDDRLTVPLSDTNQQSVAASRSGTRYYSLDCSGLNRISPENRIYFLTRERARAAGYEPAVGCEF